MSENYIALLEEYKGYGIYDGNDSVWSLNSFDDDDVFHDLSLPNNVSVTKKGQYVTPRRSTRTSRSRFPSLNEDVLANRNDKPSESWAGWFGLS